MTMPYVGVTTTHLLMPVFALFGVSVFLLVNWFQLLFGTARAVQRAQAVSDEPVPLVSTAAGSTS